MLSFDSTTRSPPIPPNHLPHRHPSTFNLQLSVPLAGGKANHQPGRTIEGIDPAIEETNPIPRAPAGALVVRDPGSVATKTGQSV